MEHHLSSFDRLRRARLIAVVTVDDPEDAAPLAEALLAGGVLAVELTLRGPHAREALCAMRRAAPDLLLGAGTVLTPTMGDAARDAGADFALAPGLDAATVRHCERLGLPFVPGVATASDVQAALSLGCRLLKLFPACAVGGPAGLRALHAPFAHLDVEWIPLGGIDALAAPDYLALPGVAAIGGSWIAPRDQIRRKEWAAIQRSAQAAMHLVSVQPLSVP